MMQYDFADFSVSASHGLTKQGIPVALPPKELSVLLLLVSRPGIVVTKEDIIGTVWKGGVVSDESLTRCLYILRKNLGEKAGCRFIDTVYGKGYRFVQPVVQREDVADRATKNAARSPVLVATLPFRMENPDQAVIISDYIQHHCHHERDWQFIPCALTSGMKTLVSSLTELKRLKGRYVLTGEEFRYGSERMLRLELTDTETCLSAGRECLLLSDDFSVDLINIHHRVMSLLECRLPAGDGRLTHHLRSADNVGWRFRRDLGRYDVGTLRNYVAERRHRDKLGGYAPGELCGLAGCYIAAENLGLAEAGCAAEEASRIVARVLETDPFNARALALEGLVGRYAPQEARKKFEQATVIGPDIPEVYYYYACHALHQGDIAKALKLVRVSLSLDAGFNPAQTLQIMLLLLRNELAEAHRLTSALLAACTEDHIILHSLHALIYARRGQDAGMQRSLKLIEAFQDISTFVYLCYTGARDSRPGAGRREGKAGMYSQRQLSPHSVYGYFFSLSGTDARTTAAISQ